MGKRVVDDASLTVVADAIRNLLGSEDQLVFPEGFESGVDEVYTAGENSGWYSGYDEGMAVGYGAGEKAGAQAERDRWWDAYQDNGNRVDYSYAFSMTGWNKQTFKPKYDIRPTAFNNAFFHFGRTDTSYGNPIDQVDMVELEQELGFVLDTSQATNLDYAFPSPGLSRLNVIDLASCKRALLYTFYGGYSNVNLLKRIERLVCYADTKFDTTTFQGCKGLEYIGFEGVIATNGLNLQWSTNLSRASMENIVGCLSTTTSGLSITLSRTAVNAAFTDAEWADLVATRNNWTINLV